MGVAPHQPASEPLGIGVEQQLVGVEAVAALGLVGPVDAIAVKLSGRNVVLITMPDVLGPLRQLNAFELAAALGIEQAEFDLLRIGREQRKISAPPVPACAEA